jgi:predicted RNase H-like HicB family nuclease
VGRGGEVRREKWGASTVFFAILKSVLRYHVAYYLPKRDDRMVVAEVWDFPGVLSQGFDLADARLMIASALEDVAQMYLEEGKPLPVPNTEASAPDADLVELLASVG